MYVACASCQTVALRPVGNIHGHVRAGRSDTGRMSLESSPANTGNSGYAVEKMRRLRRDFNPYNHANDSDSWGRAPNLSQRHNKENGHEVHREVEHPQGFCG